ncbi:MAG: NADH-quinone oxidoreductase subunit C [Candidatus Eisenbacteria bacterium]
MADEVLEKIKAKFGGAIVEVFEKTPRRTYITVDPAKLPDVAEYVYKDLGARFQIATGMHMVHSFEILYHFALDAADRILNLRVILDIEKPSIESCAERIPATEWIEREMHELLGIEFRNHPDMRHLLLTDDWPEGNYPLRRDWKDSRGGENGNEE